MQGETWMKQTEYDVKIALPKMERIKEIVYQTSLVLLLGMFLYVFASAFAEYGSMPFLSENLRLPQKLLFMGLGLLTAGQLLLLFYRRIIKWSERKLRLCMAVLFLALLVLQVVFLVTMKIRLRYDALKVLDEAISVCKSGIVSEVHLDGYFARYTNNYPILFLTAAILKAGRSIGIVSDNFHGADLLLGLVNILAIDIAVVFTVRLAGKLFGLKRAVIVLLCIVCNPLFVIWAPFYYTNTLAMPFVSGILYLFYSVFVEKTISLRSRSLRGFLLGCCIVLGVKIRATTILSILACLLYLLLMSESDRAWHNIKQKLRQILWPAACMAAGMFALLCAYRVAESRLVVFDYSDSAFPAIHWINMGAGGTGEYNIVDEQTTMSYETAEAKVSANWESYRGRVKELGISGYGMLLLQKLRLTFADAGAGYRSELGVSDLYNDANLYLVGGKSDWIGYLMQLNYVFCLFCSIVSICLYFILYKRGLRRRSYATAFLWNIAGAFCFHMLWEAGNIYSLSFALLFPIGVGYAAFYVEEWHGPAGRNMRDVKPVSDEPDMDNPRFKKMLLCAALQIILCCTCLLSIYHKSVSDPYTTNDAVVNQYIYEWGDMDMLSDEEECVQSFYVNRDFNHLAFQVRNLLYEQNDARYRIELLNAKQICVQTYEINAGDYGDYDFIRLDVNGMEGIADADTYYVRIRKIAGKEDSNMVFLSYKTGNYDAYTYGKLMTGDPSQDLCFSAYHTKENPYLTKLQFGILLGISLSVIVAIQICLLRYPAKDRFQ